MLVNEKDTIPGVVEMPTLLWQYADFALAIRRRTIFHKVLRKWRQDAKYVGGTIAIFFLQ